MRTRREEGLLPFAWNTLGSSASPRSPRGMRERMKSRRKASSEPVEEARDRLRESRLVASSGRRGRVHPPYPSFFLASPLRESVDEDAFDSGNLSSPLEIFGMSPPAANAEVVRSSAVRAKRDRHRNCARLLFCLVCTAAAKGIDR